MSNKKININDKYLKHEEIRKNDLPYIDYSLCLHKTFNLNLIDSFCDLGTSTGHLLHYVKKYNIKICGYEYFEYHKKSKYCKNDIRDSIIIYDLRDLLPNNVEKYEIVNCTEVGEHIDKNYADILIENCKKLSKKYIIFTWSPYGGDTGKGRDPHHQHLNPLSYNNYVKLMKKHNLKLNTELTKKFLFFSKSLKHFYPWWRVSFAIWEKIIF